MDANNAKLTWLIVGGTPRSGTTALGNMLGQSQNIALFHEYQSHLFFEAVECFFREEDRMRQYPSFRMYSQSMPTRAAQAEDVARALFVSVFPEKKQPRYIGTKAPSYTLSPQPTYPSWIAHKTIHITRNPFDVVLSSMRKEQQDQEGNPDLPVHALDTHLRTWIQSWNYAVAHAKDENFLHVFYEDMLRDPEQEKLRITKFLGIDDFDFSDFKPQGAGSIRERYAQAKLSDYLSVIESLLPVENWLEVARAKFARREKVGVPLPLNQCIDLSAGTGAWEDHVDSGFYSPEVEGTWTRGTSNALYFTPLNFGNTPLKACFEVIWSAEGDGTPRMVEVKLNNEAIFLSEVSLGEENGKPHTFIANVPRFNGDQAQTAKLEFNVKNPVNPSKISDSKDDRDLGLMIRRVYFEAS